MNHVTPRHIVNRHHPRGVALVLVLFAVATAFILALAFMNAQATNSGIARNATNQANARHIAESAVGIAVEMIRNNSNFRNEFTNGDWVTNHSFAGGTFTITGEDGIDTDGDGVVDGDGDLADDANDLVTITVVATFNGATHKVRAVIRPASLEDLGTVLFVVDDASSLTTQETAKKSQLENWGFTVNLISDGDSQSDFNDAMDDANVVYVGEEADSSTVANKLNDAFIGVVTEMRRQYDNLGIADSSDTWTGTTIEIVDNSHYITEEYSTGNLAITSSNTELTALSGTVAGGADTLGERFSSSSPSLVAIDAGMPLYVPSGDDDDDDDDGGTSGNTTAPGRRVALPWGGSGFDFALLNDDGLNILKRSLIWAAVTTTGTPGFIAAENKIEVKDNAKIKGWLNAPLLVSTNSTASDQVDISGDDDDDDDGGAEIDGDVHVGVGGDPNTVINGISRVTGTAAALTTPVDISAPATPSGTSIGDVTYSSGTTTINSDMHVDKLTVDNSAILIIEGNVTIIAEDEVLFDDDAQLQLADGATLTLYTEEKFKAQGNSKVNQNTADPTRFISYHNATAHWDLKENAIAYATVYAPYDLFHINGDTQFFGSVKADEMKIENNAVANIGGTGTTTVTGPQLVALYEFGNVSRPTPTLIHHWKLDETDGSGTSYYAFGAAEDIDVTGSAKVEPHNGHTLIVATNSTTSDDVYLDSSAQIKGDVLVGVGGSPSSVIDDNASPGIEGSTGTLTESMEFPTIEFPDVGASIGDVTYDTSGKVTISSSFRCDKLTVQGSTRFEINGDIIIVADDEVLFDGSAQLLFKNASSRLTLYTKKRFKTESSTQLGNDLKDPSRFICYHNATDHWDMKSSSIVYATVYAPNALFHINSSTHFFGGVQAKEIKVEGSAIAHIDGSSINGATMAIDEVGTSKGTFESVTFGAAGHDGNAIQFDGSDSHIVIPHADDMLLDEGTVSFWFNSSKLTASRGLFSKDSDGYDNGGHLHIYTFGTKVRAELDTNGTDPFGTGDDYQIESTTSLTTNTWYHVTVTWGPHGFRLFLNGTLEDTEDYIGGLGTTSGGAGNTEPIVLGASSTGSDDGSATPINNEFEGLIDDVRIYDIALSPSQANNLANDTALGASDDPGLVVEDTSNFGTALNMTIERGYNIAYSGGGLVLNGDNTILSDTDASKVQAAIAAKDELSIELLIETDDIAQFGPATIVSNASNSTTRNFSLGQVDQALDGRVTTSDTVANGTPDVSTPAGTLQAGTQTHVIMSYDGTNVTLYINGSAVTTEARTGDLSSWSSTMKLMFANEFGTDRPWHGTLYRAAIWDEGFNSVQALNVFNGNEPGDGTATNAFRVTWVEIP